MSASFRVQCFCVSESVTPLLYGLAAGMAGITVQLERVRIHTTEEARELQRDQIMRAIPNMREDGWDQILLDHPLCEHPVHFAGMHREGTLVTGLMNCFTLPPDGQVEGEDTRLEGAVAALSHVVAECGCTLHGRPALVVGDGGCAIAAAEACKRRRMLVTVASRHGGGITAVPSLRQKSEDPPATFAVVVNAGGEGAEGSTSFPGAYHRPDAVALDLQYVPGESAFCRDARRKGAVVCGGYVAKALQVMACVNALTGHALRTDEYLRAAKRLLQ